MAVEQLSTRDALMQIYNQAISELAISQLNERIIAKEERIGLTINPQIAKDLGNFRSKIAQLKNTLMVLGEMIDECEVKPKTERITN